MTLLTDPTSNLRAALILYGIIGVAVLILLVAGIGLLLSLPEDDEEELDDGVAAASGGGASSQTAPAAHSEPVEEAAPSRFWGVSLVMGVAVVMAVWALTGFTTSPDEVCRACHVDTSHEMAAKDTNPHTKTACVSCHESGGTLGRFVGDVPERLVHFASGAVGMEFQASYGVTNSGACLSCHYDDVSQTTMDDATGVKMSHKEPMAASAACKDCHKLADGVVSNRTVGMSICLRCHDAVTASSDCAMCHDSGVAAAARARTAPLAKAQVEDIKCGACHEEKIECDPCHGVRMPHTIAFRSGLHARAGAVSFWYAGGKTCQRCHTDARRPCSKCHTPLLGRGHQQSMSYSHQKAKDDEGCKCHSSMVAGAVTGRDFCELCHNPVAEQESPR